MSYLKDKATQKAIAKRLEKIMRLS